MQYLETGLGRMPLLRCELARSIAVPLQDANTLSMLVRDPDRMSNTWSTGWIKFRSWVTRIKVLPRFAARAREKRSDLSGVLIVEVVDRLVGEDERGIVDESPRNRDALLLAAAQF